MSIFKLTKSGKCDVTVTLFNRHNQMVLQRTTTFDCRPTIKEIKDRYTPFKKELGAIEMRLTVTPSCEVRRYKL